MCRFSWAVIAFVALACLPFAAGAQDLYKTTVGPYSVQKQDSDWRDEARGRDVPVRIYVPRRVVAGRPVAKPPEVSGPGKFPVIVFSHGLGASRANYGSICEHLASHGYLLVVPTHQGSDTRSVAEEVRGHIRERIRGEGREQGVLAENTSDPANLTNRPADVSFVLDRLQKDETLGKIADLDRVGVAGHSFGAYTAMVEGGMEVNLPTEKHKAMRDPRVKAVLPMSPEGGGIMGIDPKAWEHFAVPALFLTGTRDYGQGERSAAWRREAFDSIKGVDEYLVVIKDATHMTFPDGPAARLSPDHARHMELVKATATAFFDGYLRGDEKAASWLKTFVAAKHEDCTPEFHAAKP